MTTKVHYGSREPLDNPLYGNIKGNLECGKDFAGNYILGGIMERPEMPENGSTELTVKPKRRVKKSCPVCGKRLYQDSHEHWYCPRCQAEIDGEKVSFNYIPEDELNTQLQTG